jgi:UDP-2-acetamido-3-amino-2,3-dideoxy-glucuronate N-acetyltransferase
MKEKYFCHKSSYIEKPSRIGEGTKIWFFCHIMKNSVIGKYCNIGQNVFVDSNVQIGNHVKVQNNVSLYSGVVCEDGVFIGPSAVFTNVTNPRSHIERKNEFKPTLLRKGATIGANATIVCGNTIGSYAFIGAGAVVVSDIPDFSLAVGNPAKVKGFICACGERIYFTQTKKTKCKACASLYELKRGKITQI